MRQVAFLPPKQQCESTDGRTFGLLMLSKSCSQKWSPESCRLDTIAYLTSEIFKGLYRPQGMDKKEGDG